MADVLAKLHALEPAISLASLSPRPLRQTTIISSASPPLGQLHRLGDGVRAFERRHDALGGASASNAFSASSSRQLV